MAKPRVRSTPVPFISPLFFFCAFFVLWHFQRQVSTSGFQTPQNGSYAVIICGEKNVKPSLLLIHSLKQTNTQRDIVAITLDVSDSSHELLQHFGTKIFPQTSEDIRRHGLEGSESLIRSPILSNASSDCLLTKMAAWRLSEYQKVVVLDPNLVVFQNIDDLFQHPEPSAVENSDLPGRLDPSLLVIRPSHETLQKMVHVLLDVQEQLAPGVEELMLFNHFFFSWPEMDRDHHLCYGYNAHVRLAYSATWDEWVSPNLKVAHFPPCSEDFQIKWEKLYPAARKYEGRRWRLIRELFRALGPKHSSNFSPSVKNHMCHPDYTAFGQGKMKNNKFSILIHFHGYSSSLKLMVDRLSRLNQVHSMIVLPVTKFASKAIPKAVSSKPKVVTLPPGKFALSQRFLPVKQICTDCVLIMEDSVFFDPDHILSAFKVWQDHPHRLVGFYPTSHRKTSVNGSDYVHIATSQLHFSMVSTRFTFLHVDYLREFSCSVPDGLRNFINKNNDCADIAFNFFVSSKTSHSPIFFFDPDSLSADSSMSKRKSTEIQQMARLVLQSMLETPQSSLDLLQNGSSLSVSVLDSVKSSKSICLNEMKKFFGDNMPLSNTTEARSRMKRELMTKISFSEWNATSKFFPAEFALSLNQTRDYDFSPVFYVPPESKASSSPKNFLKDFPSMGISPEVFVLPSLEIPAHTLCLKGAHSDVSCYKGEPCENMYSIIALNEIPHHSTLLLGTTVIIHVLSPFLDHFHLLNTFSNLFFSFQGYSFFQPARIIFFARGGVLKSLDKWTLELSKATLGNSVKFYLPTSHSRIHCFERVVISRRYRKDLEERMLVANKFTERIFSHCNALSSGRKMKSNDFLKFKSEQDEKIVRVLFLHDNNRTVGGNPIRNLDLLVSHLNGICNFENACDLVVQNAASFQSFCQQVRHMYTADVFITVSRKALHNMAFMRSGKHVMELSPFGVRKTDHRGNKVNRELSTWMNLKHSIWYETDGPKCERNCASMYQSRPFNVSQKDVGLWLKSVLDLYKESSMLKKDL